MIAANELRIGNWVEYNPIDLATEFIQIQEIRKGDDFSDCIPIPLTEEILLKCGFFKDEPDGWFAKITNGATMDLFNGEPFHYVDGNFSPDIKYLHQLQNLYFALIGTELEINL